ncbi:MAG: competence/damage-inducible protein A [Gammaproteobacteria bacterium]|nr:competence/damage-inducible protein A [Gammaproteobacteria bacterium]MYF37391.1 competence/damage-inducible protein A [Gammaproteobacteria bacterium]
MKQITSCVLLIGNELLSGRTRESNLQYIAKHLNKKGVRVADARVLPDVHQTIADTVNVVRKKYDYVFTTGGIGPTHDDITAESIALAFGVPLELNETIASRIKSSTSIPASTLTNRLRMARVPQGAGLIENLTGGPQGFYLENVYVMAGIPSVLRAMLPTIEIATSTPVLSCSLEVLLGESHLAHELDLVQQTFQKVEIGSYPFSRDGEFGTSVVFRGTDTDLLIAAFEMTKQALLRLGSHPMSETFDWDIG